jgi:hypothetical protein
MIGLAEPLKPEFGGLKTVGRAMQRDPGGFYDSLKIPD